jgi:hypothetical protein
MALQNIYYESIIADPFYLRNTNDSNVVKYISREIYPIGILEAVGILQIYFGVLYGKFPAGHSTIRTG